MGEPESFDLSEVARGYMAKYHLEESYHDKC